MAWWNGVDETNGSYCYNRDEWGDCSADCECCHGTGRIDNYVELEIEKEAEYKIIRSRQSLQADILKVAHHGSSSSSTLPFLEKVNPTVALISVGARAMGRLPHPEVIRRFQDLGCRVYRTDRHGAMTVVTDGEKIKIIPTIADHETGRKE